MRFDGDALMTATGTEVGRIWIKRKRWHWRAVTARPGRRASGSTEIRDRAKRELLAYVQCAARESRLAA